MIAAANHKAPEALAMSLGEALALDLSQTAAAITMSESWVRRECSAGRFPHVRCGRRLLFRPEAIREWLAARETGGGVQ